MTPAQVLAMLPPQSKRSTRPGARPAQRGSTADLLKLAAMSRA